MKRTKKLVIYYLVNNKNEPVGGKKALFKFEIDHIKLQDGTTATFEEKHNHHISVVKTPVNDSLKI